MTTGTVELRLLRDPVLLAAVEATAQPSSAEAGEPAIDTTTVFASADDELLDWLVCGGGSSCC